MEGANRNLLLLIAEHSSHIHYYNITNDGFTNETAYTLDRDFYL